MVERYFEVEARAHKSQVRVLYMTLAETPTAACAKVMTHALRTSRGEKYELNAVPTTPGEFSNKLMEMFTV